MSQTHVSSKSFQPIRNKIWVFIIIAALLYFAVMHLSLPGFSIAAQKTFAIFCVAAFLWITSALPIAITGLVVLLLLPLTHAVSPHQAYGYFGNHAIFFVLGAFILASPVMRSGLSTRIALKLISHCSRGPLSLLFSIFVLSSGLSFIISEHAVAAMLLPICMEIVKATSAKKGSRFGFAVFLAMGWGAVIGGTATLLGGARAPLALGILENTTHYSISFLQWIMYTLPIVIPLLVIACGTIIFIGWKSDICIQSARAQLEVHHTALGKLSKREIYTVLILMLTVVLWIVYGKALGLDLVAFFGVLLAFCFGITHWKEVEEDVPWGIFLMYGSAIALSAALRDTGAASGLVHLLVQSGIEVPILIFIVVIVVASFLTEAMSNAATVAVLMPVALVIANQYQIDPRAITVAIATAAGLTFLLPVSTPAIAIITNCSYVNPQRALLWGLIPKIIGLLVVIGIACLVWPLLGIKV